MFDWKNLSFLLMSVLIWFVNPNINNAGPDWIWQKNPIKTIFFKQDGKLRKNTQLIFFLIFVTCMVMVWLSA